MTPAKTNALATGTSLLADDVVLRHPFRMDPVHGPGGVLSALEDLRTTVGGACEEIEAFRNEAAQALIWRTQDGRIEGCTLTLLAGPEIAEIRIMLRPAHELGGWRDRLRALAPQGEWDLPETVARVPDYDPSEPVDPHFPFPVAENAVFNSPILRRKPRGAELVKTVIGHASAVYGHRKLGPVLGGGARRVSYWTGNVSGFPVEMAGMIDFDADGSMVSTTVFMQPMPVVELFRDLVRYRLKDVLEDDYF